MGLSVILIDRDGIFARSRLNQALISVQKKFKIKGNREIELHIIDDDKMQKINHRYRGINKTTDVLSFPFLKQKDHSANKFILPNKIQKKLLGQVFISIDQIKEQARSAGVDKERQALRLFIHGLLHLLGFDHKTDLQELKMRKYEKQIIKNIYADKI